MSERSISTIDKNSLDEELVAQPELYHEHAIGLADAKNEMNLAKARLELTEAKVGSDIRSNPGKYKVTSRVTEQLVETMIKLSVEYQNALAEFNEARHAVDVLEAAVKTLDQKKVALENLVVLQGSDYFSEVRMPKGRKEEVDAALKRKIRKPLREGQ